MKPFVTIVNWNVEWRAPSSRCGVELRRRIKALDPDVVCLTETVLQFMDGSGSVVSAGSDYGYPSDGDRRKVLLWSKRPWSMVDDVGHPDLPPGRFVRGRTDTPIGELDVVGVCIPWPGAHVTTGRKDRQRWDEHLDYLSCLGRILPERPSQFVILGDFNQRIPRKFSPSPVYEALHDCIVSRMTVPTAGAIGPAGELLIDHVAHSQELIASDVTSLSNVDEEGRQLTDHLGVTLKLMSGKSFADVGERHEVSSF